MSSASATPEQKYNSITHRTPDISSAVLPILDPCSSEIPTAGDPVDKNIPAYGAHESDILASIPGLDLGDVPAMVYAKVIELMTPEQKEEYARVQEQNKRDITHLCGLQAAVRELTERQIEQVEVTCLVCHPSVLTSQCIAEVVPAGLVNAWRPSYPRYK
jgi:hypothetical protein